MMKTHVKLFYRLQAARKQQIIGNIFKGFLLVALTISATAISCASATRVTARDFPSRTSLLIDGKPNVLIVYGEAHRDLAKSLQDNLRKLCGTEFSIMPDMQATGGSLWRLRDEIQRQNLIALGDINTNRAVLALYAKFLDSSTGGFPGQGRYVIRHLAEPFTPARTALVIGASDIKGLELGIARFLELLQKENIPTAPEGVIPNFAPSPLPENERFTLGFPLLEYGDADGPENIKEKGDRFRDYRDAAFAFYSGGRPTERYMGAGTRSPRAAMRTARKFVMDAMERDGTGFPVGGHFTFTPNYQALRIIIAHGLLSADELQKLEEKLLDNAIDIDNAFSSPQTVRMLTNYQERYTGILQEGWHRGNPSRHSSAAIVGQYHLLYYLKHFASLHDKPRRQVQADYEVYTHLIRGWSEEGIYRALTDDWEALDCTALLIYGFMHLGLEDVISSGIIENMANFYLNSVNNLWCDAGASFYIGAYKGRQFLSPPGGLAVRMLAFFTGDRALDFLDAQRFEQSGTYRRGFNDRGLMQLNHPEPFALPPMEEGDTVTESPMLRKTPMDPWMWKRAKSRAQDADEKHLPEYRQVYDTAGIRDGWSEKDAFLALKGFQNQSCHSHPVWHVNSITGSTELGAQFLLGGSMTYENWYRSSVTVDTAEYRMQDDFASLEAYMEKADAAFISSTVNNFNATRWQRTVLRVKGAYTAVMDDLTALNDDDYRITVTWRILPPGDTDANGVFRARAENGVEFAVIPASAYPASVTRPPVDGHSRPTFYRQERDVALRSGETASFHNILTASMPGESRQVKTATVGSGRMMAVLSEQHLSPALIGTGRLPGIPGLPAGECSAFYISVQLWMAGGTRKIRLGTDSIVESSLPVDFAVNWETGTVKIVLHGSSPSDVILAPSFGGTGKTETLQPGEHFFAISAGRGAYAVKAAGKTLLSFLPEFTERQPADSVKAEKLKDGLRLEKIWSKQVQPPDKSVIRPVRVHTETPPVSMALDRIHNGFVQSPSIPRPLWREKELVFTLEPWDEHRHVTGLRIIGGSGIGNIRVEGKKAPGDEYVLLEAEESAETLFTVRSTQYVGADLFATRRMDFPRAAGKLRIRLEAENEDAPAIGIGEIQLLDTSHETDVWGMLLTDSVQAGGPSVIFARTGTYADTLEKGGLLQAFSTDGKLLWSHAESATAQYGDNNWLFEDTNGDGRKELVTYGDDMLLRIFSSTGEIKDFIDLKNWEEQLTGRPMVPSYRRFGAKSIVIWPERGESGPEIQVFSHVHRYLVRPGKEPQVIRHRQNDLNAAPAASVKVSGWSGNGKQNLVGITPYYNVLVLWEEAGPGQQPGIILQQPIQRPLVRTPNNQMPAFIDGRRVNNPEGVIAAVPRGMQFFAKPDLAPGWVFAGMCPLSALAVVPQEAGKPDMILAGRENGRILKINALTGTVKAETLLRGRVRRIAVMPSRQIIAGTDKGLFVLDWNLSLLGSEDFAVEDVVLCETERESQPIIVALSASGLLAAFRIVAPD